jgi:hypothetical protein
MGVEAHLDSDLAIGVREALANYTRRLDSESPPLAMPRFDGALPTQSAKAFDLPVDDETWEALEREAARQGVTVSELATHSVLVYLAEIDGSASLSTA